MTGKSPNNNPLPRAPPNARQSSRPASSGRASAPKLGRGKLRHPGKHFASYDAGIEYLANRINIERTRPEKVDPASLKLDRMHAIMGAMGDPHRATKFVHVAGSKGKGSTCEMITSCLCACGYTTGLYTSPHLVDIRERVRIGPAMISYADFLLHLGRAAAAAEAVQKKFDEPTFFELLTALAFSYFAEEAVDVAVIEVGLGGRLDSTNVITPEVCALTAIQLEHTQILGDTLEKIAREKAGIIKPGVPIITIPQQTSAILEVIRGVAGAVGAPLSILGQDLEFSCRFVASPGLGRHARVCLTTKHSEFEHLVVPLMGAHQSWNCGLALGVLDAMRTRGFKTPERKVAEGLGATPSHGRLEEISRNPHIVIDGAHNPESIEGLVHAIGAHIRPDSLVVIFGCAADKNIPGMLRSLSHGADKIIFTRSGSSPRAADPKDLQRTFAEKYPKMTQVAATLEDALSIAERAVHHGDLICVTGSFYLAGDAKKLLADRARRNGSAQIEAKPASKERSGR